MSRNLVNERIQRKWTPSPELTIKEEDDKEESYQIKAQKNRLIEEEENDDDLEDSEEENEEDTEEEEEEGSEYSSSPSIPDENINFDLVYTLHTFEATVDGQASVKKGDALTLLDDTNSYWWLIRNLKSSEVGYIPAENIETPFERLARLNKHRNVELTSVENATFFINDKNKKPANIHKKVQLSTSLHFQLQVLFTGENEEDVQDETFECWNEEMINDDEEEEEEEAPIPVIKLQPVETKNRFIECEIEEQENLSTPNQTDSIRRSSRVIEVPFNFKVIKVYAGNFDVGASYHSVRITENTSVNEMLSNALEKFHISEIETKHGRSYGKNSCVEYFLAVKTRDGDELTLDSEDKPYEIHESLTAHLTTPMPSLTQFKQLNSSTSSVNKKKKKRSQSEIQFCLHKRIKRIDDKSGQVHIKVSLMTTTTLSTPFEKTNTIKKVTALLGRSKSNKKELLKTERIDKLIATADNIIISDLTALALVKFHIIDDIEQPHQYNLVLNCDGKDQILDKNQKLSDVLSSVGNQTKEKYFILRSPTTNTETSKSLSKSSSASSSSSSSKVFPENAPTYPIMTSLDSTTQAILKRVDAALQTYEPATVPQPNRKDSANPNFPSPMSVCRNKNGVDIHLPNGLLRSTILPGNKTQYSLMKFPNTLVLQRILPDDSKSTNSEECSTISAEELATLIKYGTQYLNAYDTAKGPSHHLQLAVDPDQLFAEKESDKSLSSLADLEKELFRIISSHSS